MLECADRPGFTLTANANPLQFQLSYEHLVNEQLLMGNKKVVSFDKWFFILEGSCGLLVKVFDSQHKNCGFELYLPGKILDKHLGEVVSKNCPTSPL